MARLGAARSESLPVLNLLNPVVAAVFGVVASSERAHASAPAQAFGVLGLAAALFGIFLLARIPTAAGDSAAAVAGAQLAGARA